MNPADLDTAMSAMSASLAERGPADQALTRIVRAAVETLPSADYASITSRRPNGRLETLAMTDELVLHADVLQYELREGPCYDAVTSAAVRAAYDLAHDTQWPRFGPRVAELGLRSQMALRLSDQREAVTGLNLYAHALGAFDEGDVLARLFASHARVALGFATQLQTLQGAIESREVIGKAIGVVMERYAITDERAFEFLIRLSQDNNVKLREVAAEVVRTVELEEQGRA